jgi:hypothetical protein
VIKVAFGCWRSISVVDPLPNKCNTLEPSLSTTLKGEILVFYIALHLLSRFQHNGSLENQYSTITMKTSRLAVTNKEGWDESFFKA